MSARADQVVHVPVASPLRWLGVAALIAAAATFASRLRERAQRPSVPPMSADWLQRHAADRRYHTPE